MLSWNREKNLELIGKLKCDAALFILYIFLLSIGTRLQPRTSREQNMLIIRSGLYRAIFLNSTPFA